jgi:serine-type D-Ala-D-Ala carboxypeptidase/endopeptidase
MRRRDVLALLAAAALSQPRPARAGTAELDEAVGFAGQVLFLSAKVPALVIGVVRNGQTSIHGFGRREDGANVEPDGDTLFRIGSVTKAFTGQVLASLAADGVVSLADPLTKYVPDFIAPLSEGGRPIRLIDLATHSAGLPREVPHAPGPPDDPFATITREAFVSWLKANPLLFTPGTAILYSNFGFDLLAAALAAAAQKPYPDLIAERVLKPLGLSDTTFAPSGDQTARLMQGHGFDGAPLPNAPTGSVIVGSGGLYSTARDLLRWLEWHLDRFGGQGAAERLVDHAAYLWRDGLISVVGMDESGPMEAMGLGWVVMRPEGGRPLILQKAGGLQGIFSYVAFAPMRDIGVVAAINAFDFNAGLAIARTANDLIAELAPR